MPYRQLITIPMPTGITNDTLHLSLALVPRLQEDGVLSEYAADWAQWPNIANSLDYTVQLDNAPPINPARVTVVSDPADLGVWETVFGSTTDSKQPVSQYTFIDRRAAEIVDFPAGEVLDGLRKLIAEVSDTHPEEPPSRKEALQLAAASLFKGSTLIETEEYLEPTGDTGEDDGKQHEDGPGVEFHELMTVFRAHPLLLRLLGLVVDLDIELDPARPQPRFVRVATDWAAITGMAPRDECALRMQIDGDGWPLPLHDDEHDGNWLRLSNRAFYRMTTSDLTSASQRLLDYQRTVLNRDGDESAPMPVAREGGVAAVHTALATVLDRRFARQRLLEDQIDEWYLNLTNDPPVIGLEDVVSGYRYDVLDLDSDTPKTWRSVFERRTDGYVFPREPKIGDDIEVPDDEGRHVLALFTEMPVTIGAGNSQVRYGEGQIKKSEGRDMTIWRAPIDAFRWNGWSAATPHPGSSLDGSGQAIEPAANTAAPDQEAQVDIDYRPVPGTLPRLRYGRTYQMRARATDFAGNSRTVADPEPEAAVSEEIVFGRTQPVEAPLAVRSRPRPVPGVGESATTLVIKSELDQPDDEVAPTARLLFPPRLSQARLELHGLPEGGIDPDSYDFLAERDALRLDDQAGVDPRTGELVAGSFDADGNHNPADAQPAVGYLADPTAVGVTLADAPGADDALVVPFRAGWPDTRALEVELGAGDDATRVPANGVVEPVHFSVPRGRVRTVEVSHAVDRDLVDQFDAFRALSATRQGELRRLVEDGRHHVISARNELRLVHAVRVPVLPALFTEAAVDVDRDPGSRFGRYSGDISIDRPSTRQVVLRGSWTDPVDDPGNPHHPQPFERSFVADAAVAIDIDPDQEFSGRHDATTLDLIDARRHTVTMDMDAFSRFSRFFTEQVDDFSIPSTAAGRNLPVSEGVVARSVQVTTPDGTYLERGKDFTVDREVGTIFRVEGGAMLPDVAHTVRYIPLPIARPSLGHEGGITTEVFPAAIRPTAPVVADVVPAARRDVRERPNRVVVEHDGRVLRVLLKRPWWSSGEDERLAVTLDATLVPGEVPSRTRWGRDPLIAGGDALPTPTVGQFPLATETQTGVDGDAGVDIAAHAVYFDAERDVWLADVAIDAEVGERPFVQLGLARYQPIALDGLAMSSEVQTEPVRIGPRRRVVVSRTATTGTVRCLVDHAPRNHLVQIRVQEVDPAIDDPDLRWHDAIDAATGDEVVVELTDGIRDGVPHHRGLVELPTASSDLRLLIEELEPVTRTDPATGDPIDGHETVYRETVEIPAGWRS